MAEQPQKQMTGRPLEVAEEMANAIPTNFSKAFAKVVQAGMKVMFNENTHKFMMVELQKEGEMSEKIGSAIAGLMLLLYKQSNDTMPAEVVVPAGIYLLGKGADYLEKVTGEQFTPDVIAGATQAMIEILAGKFGIDPKNLYMAAGKAANGEYQ